MAIPGAGQSKVSKEPKTPFCIPQALGNRCILLLFQGEKQEDGTEEDQVVDIFAHVSSFDFPQSPTTNLLLLPWTLRPELFVLLTTSFFCICPDIIQSGRVRFDLLHAMGPLVMSLLRYRKRLRFGCDF